VPLCVEEARDRGPAADHIEAWLEEPSCDVFDRDGNSLESS
jgi:hypothetical protein